MIPLVKSNDNLRSIESIKVYDLIYNKTPAQAFTRATDFCNVQGTFERSKVLYIYGLI